jgi:hypothetical protein
LKRKQEVEGETRSGREDKELKSKEDQEKRASSQEDDSVRPYDLEFIHPSSQTKPKNLLEAIFTKYLTLHNNLENLHQSFEVFDLAILSIHIKLTSCPIITKTLKTKLKQINTLVVLFDYIA